MHEMTINFNILDVLMKIELFVICIAVLLSQCNITEVECSTRKSESNQKSHKILLVIVVMTRYSALMDDREITIASLSAKK